MTKNTDGSVDSATAAGTRGYADRFDPHPGQYRDVLGLHWSSVGIGTYLGGVDDETDAQVTDAVRAAVNGGINVIDTAANYRR